MIPEAIRAQVLTTIREAGDNTPLREEQTGERGGVSETAHLQTKRGDYFLKWNSAPWFGTFTNETFHLSLLRATDTVRVPHVFGFAEGEEGQPAWMLQEWIGGATPEQETNRLGATLGEKMAALHKKTAGSAPGHGFPQRNDDGTVRLPTQEWPTFFYEAHLRHHIERARKENRWSPERNQRVDRLIERLPELLGGTKIPPTLLHGDLHSCNVRCAADGEPVIADPWLYYGDREHEIVSTLVSGDFPPAFYDAYNAVYPLEPGFAERIDLHKLAWLFSDGYAPAISDPILQRYAG